MPARALADRAPGAVSGMVTAWLLAGRGGFRLAGQLMTVVLAAVWGARTYAQFANAVGVCVWLAYLPTAAEKAALKLVPRGGVLAADLARPAFWAAVGPALLLAVATGVAALVAPTSTAVLYLATATWSTCTGGLMTLSGLHRLNGRPALDSRSFGVAAVLVVAVTAVTWRAGLRPATHVLLLVAAITPVLVLSAAALPVGWRRGRARRRVGRLFARTLVLMGVTELVDAVALGILFVLLAAYGRLADSGPFYLTVLPFGALGSVMLYLLRVRQPQVSLRLRGTGAAAGRAGAERILRGVERIGAGCLVAAVAALAVPSVRERLGAAPGTGGGAGWQSYALLAVLGAVELAGYLAVTYAGYLLENTTGAVLTRTAAAGLGRLAVAVVAGAVLVGPAGVYGAFAALIVSLVAHAALLRRLTRRPARRPAGPTDPWAPAPGTP